ncbi:MAG: hypothetical protein JSV78_08625 [Phycisphaerales bacterium]|nr:MAG: hypothetical protein JSV78_08625 [Phycisphaerales bacterium]
MEATTAARRWTVVAFTLLALTTVSCERVPAPRRPAGGAAAIPTPPPQPDPSELSPLETAKRVHQLRLAGDFAVLERHLVPEQRSQNIELIQSVDQLVVACEVLEQAVRERFGNVMAEAFADPGIANIIGVFSSDVEMIAEEVEGDRAVVSVQVAGRLPLEQIELAPSPEGWQIRTDPPVEGVAAELRGLADAMNDAARRIRADDMTPEEFQRTLSLRWSQVQRRITALTETSRSRER